MSVWILVAGMFVMGALAAGYGALMLISPRKWGKIVDRASLADHWSSPIAPRSRGADIQTRIAGLIMAGVGIFFVYISLHGLVTAGTSWHTAKIDVSNSGVTSHSWFELAVPSVSILIGLSLLVFPDSFLRWGAKKMQPPREIKSSAVRFLRVFVRVMAVLALVGGISGVYAWFQAIR